MIFEVGPCLKTHWGVAPPEETMISCYQGPGVSGCQVPAPRVHNKGASLLLLFVWKAPDPIASTTPVAWRGGWILCLAHLQLARQTWHVLHPLTTL